MTTTIRLTFKVYDSRLIDTISHDVTTETTFESVARQILRQMKLSTDLAEWQLRHNGNPVGWNTTAGKLSARIGSRDLVLYLDRDTTAKKKSKPDRPGSRSSTPSPAAPLLPPDPKSPPEKPSGKNESRADESEKTDDAFALGASDSGLKLDDDSGNTNVVEFTDTSVEIQEEDDDLALEEGVDDDFDADYTDDDGDMAAMAPVAASPPRGGKQRRVAPSGHLRHKKGIASREQSDSHRPTAEKQVTVRYFDRMNPARVFPLLVTITKEEVEKIQQKRVQQTSSGPVKMKLDVPVEIEPVLPGCTCHPPVVRTRPTQENYKFTFYVVPNVVGKVKGACVRVRQEETTLSHLDLNIRVVPRTIVVVGAIMTFGLPFFASLLRHFGLDFSSQAGEGFTGYLMLASLIFDRISPLGLTGLLAAVTGGFWFATRPRQKSLFDSVNTVDSLDTQLQKIREQRNAGKISEATQALLSLLNQHPRHQPALLYYAGWHFAEKDFQEAMSGYQKALDVGPLPTLGDYLKLAGSATRVGDHEQALVWLSQGESAHPHATNLGQLSFNRACYLTKVGRHSKAIAALEEACERGHHAFDQYETDPDLDPLRSRDDFQAVVRRLRELQL